jgi:hypothetical protein
MKMPKAKHRGSVLSTGAEMSAIDIEVVASLED